MKLDDPHRAAREPSAVEKRLVVVVHGLGDENAGDTLRSFARSIAAATGRERASTEEVLWLPENSDRLVETFPCHVERLRHRGAETVLAEVYWADLSRLGRGIWALLLGLYRLIFGLHESFARHGADPARPPDRAQEPVAAALQKLLLASAYLVRGPAAAAALLFAFAGALGAGVMIVGGPTVEQNQLRWLVVLAGSTGLIALAVGFWGLLRRRGRPYAAFYPWLALFGSMNLAVWPFAKFMNWTAKDALDKAWVHVLNMSYVPPLFALCLIWLALASWCVARFRASPIRRPGIDLAQAMSFAMVGLWVLVIQFLTVVSLNNLPDAAVMTVARDSTRQLASAMAFYWILALVVVVSLLVILWLRSRWVKKTRAESYDASRPAPRLLFGNGVLFSLISITVLTFVLPWFPEVSKRLAGVFGEAHRVAIPAAGLILVVATYASEGLRSGFDFALDIVGHFERTVVDGKPAFVRRERIRNRLRIVLKTLVRNERPDRVTVVAHSWGTVVAVEALAEDGAEALLEPLPGCDLVTMASPFHHILQHYFPNEYPPLRDGSWKGLRRRVDRWCNIFRIDDFVGTDIEPGGEWPENRPVDPGGHTDYWRDRQVLRILDDRQLV